MSGEEFEVRQSRAKALLGVAGCVAFVALGWWMKDEPGLKPQVAAWLCIPVFGVSAVVWLAALVRPAKLSVTRSGVAFRSAFRARTLSWSEIAGVETRKLKASTFVYLRFADPQSSQHWSDKVGRLFDWSGPGMFLLGTAWAIPQQELADRLMAARESFARQAPSRSADPIVM